MIETIAGRYNAVQLVSPQDQEDLDEGFTSLDEMDGLSDSHSSLPSHSRPTTPSEIFVHPPRVSSRPQSRDRSYPVESETETPHFTVASKASLILGLVPGTLSHAMACLENARDEARRLFDVTPISADAGQTATEGGTKKAVGRMDRARKAMSIAMPSPAAMARRGSAVAVPPVIMSVGGEEEEKNRERRRRVADGVLHWQKEVQRLRDAEAISIVGREREMGGMSRKGKARR